MYFSSVNVNIKSDKTYLLTVKFVREKTRVIHFKKSFRVTFCNLWGNYFVIFVAITTSFSCTNHKQYVYRGGKVSYCSHSDIYNIMSVLSRDMEKTMRI